MQDDTSGIFVRLMLPLLWGTSFGSHPFFGSHRRETLVLKRNGNLDRTRKFRGELADFRCGRTFTSIHIQGKSQNNMFYVFPFHKMNDSFDDLSVRAAMNRSRWPGRDLKLVAKRKADALCAVVNC